MGVDRLGPAHRPDDRELAEGVVEMVVAADDVGHAHVVIVDHHREHVGRAAVRAQQDEIVDLGIAATVTRPWTRSSIAVSPSAAPSGGRRTARRAGPSARGRAMGCRCGTGGARPAPPRAARRAPRLASYSSDRRGRARAAACATSAWRGANCDWKWGSPSQSRPSQRIPSRIASIAAWVERALSVSSIRSRNLPPWWRAIEPVEQARCARRRYGGSRSARARSA